ncbi:hypothetical protein [Urechidicola vernalis]|uniref:Por secretion system C-terminal sorting domain-containing protein n=1 Tax=Urechidicola vernalis TaxID=3075600 RepID=A0ABU2Y4K0_9FLAO|nr:hypothetical protein [Urechidicola sp. P050]MDT0553119.1 hypothetical protein [Urechidicola sp. P050]
MKNLMKRSIVLVALMVGFLSNAENLNSAIKLSKIESKLVNLTLSQLSDNVNFEITDEEGVSLYTELVNATRFSKNYNFEFLSNGNYFLEFHGETKIRKIPFKIVNEELVILEEEEKVIYKPSVTVDQDMVNITLLSLNKEDSLDIKFYDSYDRLLYSELVTGENIIGKRINTGELLKGEYSVILKYKGETFIEEIKK